MYDDDYYDDEDGMDDKNGIDGKCISCLYHKPSGECFCLDSLHRNENMDANDSCSCWKKYGG
jgi:hypothetical protein